MGVRYVFGLSNKWVATTGVSVSIVLNFGILNILLSLPILSDQYNVGPSDEKRTAIAINSMGTNKKTRIIIASEKSKIRFINIL